MKQVIVKVDKRKGTISFEVKGVPGSSCTEITDILMMGMKVNKSEFTEDYNKQAVNPDFIENL